jgi:hypothetical protein
MSSEEEQGIKSHPIGVMVDDHATRAWTLVTAVDRDLVVTDSQVDLQRTQGQGNLSRRTPVLTTISPYVGNIRADI